MHVGGWLLADITGGREALREMVHPVLRDLVDELEPCDDDAIWREIPTTALRQQHRRRPRCTNASEIHPAASSGR